MLPRPQPRASAPLRRRLAVTLAVVLLASGCALPPCPDRPAARVQLLSVNDTYVLEPDAEGRGGLARVATLVRRLRQDRPGTLFALARDTLSPSLLSSLFRGRHMVEVWNALGPATLLDRMKASRFP